MDICKNEHIDVIIPLIDPELPVLAGAQKLFLEVGTTISTAILQ